MKYLIGFLFIFVLIQPVLAKEGKTIITGDEMEILNGGDKVVFTGNSRITNGRNILNAKQLIQDKKNSRVDASGNIDFKVFTKDNEPVLGLAQKAYYDMKNKRGELSEGRPEIKYFVKTSTGPLKLLADNILFDDNKEEIHAVGKVEIISSSACANSQDAVFLNKGRKMVLTTSLNIRPSVEYSSGDSKCLCSADSIIFLLDENKSFFEGNVQGKLSGKEGLIK